MTSSRKVFESYEYAQWFTSLLDNQRAAVLARVNWLYFRGPAAGRPYVDHIKGSQIHHLKELRISSSGQLRILFAFTHQRHLVLLVGGDKSVHSQWNSWYRTAIPLAEEIYERFDNDQS